MAVKEELIVEARAETSDAEQGLAKVAKAATALADAEQSLATEGAAATDSLDDLATATKEAEKQIEGAKKETREFYDTFKQVEQGAEDAKKQIGDAGNEAAKAGDKLASATSGGKKFTDMLREVGDEADTAVGSIVEGIGGPGFVKALGGAGIAFAGAKAGAEAFLDSSEQLFRSYGPEGQAIWDETEKKVFAIKGAFAAAVLGGDDLNTNAKRMNDLLDGTKTAVTALFSPLAQFSKAVFGLSDAYDALSRGVNNSTKAEDEHTKAIASNLESSREVRAVYNDVITANRDLLFSKKELAAMDLAATIQGYDNLILMERESAARRANAEGDLAAAIAYAEATESAMGKAMKEAAKIQASMGPEELLESSTVKIAEELVARDTAFQKYRAAAVRTARESTIAMYDNLNETESREVKRILDLRENAIQQAEELGLPPLSPAPVTTTTTGGAGGPKKEVDDLVYALELASGGYAELTKSQADFLIASQTMLGDSSSRIIEMTRKEFEAIDDIQTKILVADAITSAKQEAIAKADAEKAVAAETALQAALAAVRKASDAARKAEAEKLKKDIENSWKSFKDSSKALGLQNLQDALSGIGTTLGQTAKAGGDFASALGDTMEALVGQIAGQWGDLFLKQGIGLMFLDPVAGAGLLAAGIGLKALAGFMGGGDTATDAGSTGASGVQPSATTTTVARPEASFGYFEGGRSPVTIVTNDAASIRTMQNRLNFVAARGGSGV